MESTVNIKLDFSGMQEVEKACKALDRNVKVGILNDAEEAQIGYLQHFGGTGKYTYGKYKGKEVEVPARPFISAPAEHFSGTALKAGAESFNFTEKDADRVLNAIGDSMATVMKNLINSNGHYPPPNSPRTIETKGFDHPLIDTGKMRDSITYEVDEK